MINWLKYKYIYFSISILALSLGLFGILKWGLRLSIDFTGGVMAEYVLGKDVSIEDIKSKIENEVKANVSSISKVGDGGSYIFRISSLNDNQKEKLKDILKEAAGDNFKELRFENVGPSVGPELVKKTVYAIVISSFFILLMVARQFSSFKFGISAILAMFHDSFILISSFSWFGHFFGAEVDFLFVTALLTTLSFSVHDTIVVYDRIRELQRKEGGEFVSLANRALSETMVRSLNNSFTIIFMLVAMILLGGSTIKWFAVALLLGTIAGTYSSPFVAVPLLVVWNNWEEKIRLRKLSR
ncbi:MAG: protein-export membrane protein SecF [Patescibacteria group bacterium]|nr:MAG: protein-export membrane protein SecF [Patescibacteria group bacterium]